MPGASTTAFPRQIWIQGGLALGLFMLIALLKRRSPGPPAMKPRPVPRRRAPPGHA